MLVKSTTFFALFSTLLVVVSAVPVDVARMDLVRRQDAPPANNNLPADNTALPADNTALPADNTALPADNTALPADNTALPADNTALPADNTALPADNTALPANGTDIAVQNLPADNTALPPVDEPLPLPVEDGPVLELSGIKSDHAPPAHVPPVHEIKPVHPVPIVHPVPQVHPVKLVAAPVHHVPIVKPVHHVQPPVHVVKPIHHVEPPKHVKEFVHHSFNNWGGFTSLNNFDNFHGVDNFDGFNFKQTFVKDRNLVCHSQRVEIIQQRLLVLQELAKRIVTETICEVEVQTIVFEQFHAGLGGFSHDLRRLPNHHQIGFDEKIVSHFPKLIHADGSLNFDDWGFSGHDLGKHTVLVGGHNWVDNVSFKTVKDAWLSTRTALGGLWFRN